jgi:hypothetical protein
MAALKPGLPLDIRKRLAVGQQQHGSSPPNQSGWFVGTAYEVFELLPLFFR